jgi:outer membrane protein assembly factor BamD
MARESVADKMVDRYRDTIDEYYAFKNEFPESQYLKEAEKIYRDAQKALQ